MYKLEVRCIECWLSFRRSSVLVCPDYNIHENASFVSDGCKNAENSFYSRRKRNKEYCCKRWEKGCRTSNMVRVQFYFHEFTEVGFFKRCMFTFLSQKLRCKIRTTFYLASYLSYTSATMSIYDRYKFFEAARCRICRKKGT